MRRACPYASAMRPHGLSARRLFQPPPSCDRSCPDVSQVPAGYILGKGADMRHKAIRTQRIPTQRTSDPLHSLYADSAASCLCLFCYIILYRIWAQMSSVKIGKKSYKTRENAFVSVIFHIFGPFPHSDRAHTHRQKKRRFCAAPDVSVLIKYIQHVFGSR